MLCAAKAIRQPRPHQKRIAQKAYGTFAKLVGYSANEARGRFSAGGPAGCTAAKVMVCQIRLTSLGWSVFVGVRRRIKQRDRRPEQIECRVDERALFLDRPHCAPVPAVESGGAATAAVLPVPTPNQQVKKRKLAIMISMPSASAAGCSLHCSCNSPPSTPAQQLSHG